MRALVLSGSILAMSGLAPAALNAELVGDAALHIPGESVAQLRQAGPPRCGHGDRGRLLDAERVASYPTAADAQAYYDEWIAFYLGI